MSDRTDKPIVGSAELAKSMRGLPDTSQNYFINSDVQNMALPRNIRFFVRNRKVTQMGKCVHNPFMLIVNFETTAGVILDSKFLRLCPGQALLIFPNQFHHYALMENKPVLWLFCGFELREFGYLKRLLNTPVPINEAMVRNLKDALATYTQGVDKMTVNYNSRQVSLRVDLLLEQMLEMVEWTEHSEDMPEGDKINNRTNWLLHTASNYIRDNLEKPLSIEDVASQLCVSPGHLRNVFHQNLGFGLGKYIRYIRMHRACMLMDTTDENIENIALQCGYNSLFSFSRAFKKDKGFSPTEYRKKFCS